MKYNPHKSFQIAAGLFNGSVAIINTETSTIDGLYKTGSFHRVLCLDWSPFFEQIIATGSFDNIVRIHDIKKNTVIELKEHKDRVRSLVWNHEIPWMLISAADD